MTIGQFLSDRLGPTTGTVIMGTSPTAMFDMVVLDTTTRRSHGDEADVATFPVEGTQSFGTDNVRALPPTLLVSGVLSETPVLPLAGTIQGPGRAQDQYNKLLAWLNTGTLLLVGTDIRTHMDVVLRSVNADEDASSGDAIVITLGFVKVQILATTTAPVQFDVAVAMAGAGGTLEAGKQTLGDWGKGVLDTLGKHPALGMLGL